MGEAKRRKQPDPDWGKSKLARTFKPLPEIDGDPSPLVPTG